MHIDDRDFVTTQRTCPPRRDAPCASTLLSRSSLAAKYLAACHTVFYFRNGIMSVDKTVSFIMYYISIFGPWTHFNLSGIRGK